MDTERERVENQRLKATQKRPPFFNERGNTFNAREKKSRETPTYSSNQESQSIRHLKYPVTNAVHPLVKYKRFGERTLKNVCK